MGVVVLSSVVSVGTVTAMWLLSGRQRAGWVVSLCNQPLWVALTFMTGAWGLLPLNVVMTVIAVRGLRYWGRERRER